MELIDSHSHINHENFINNSDTYIREASNNNVTTFLCVGWDIQSSIDAIKLANKHKNVYACVGVHPSDVKNLKENDLVKIKELLKENKVIAIGEVGLDFYYENDKNERDKQIEYFIKFINIANEFSLPIIIHSREATNITYEILNKHRVLKGGIMHCYAAGEDYVERYIKLGFYFGIGGVVTFKNAKSMKESVKKIPLNRILLESDAPYLTPTPFRGQENHSKYLIYTLKEIASLKNLTEEEVARKTSKNFWNLFSVKHN